MKLMKEYTIPFVGLKQGTHHFEYKIDNTFFKHFEYDEFNTANVTVTLAFEKKLTLLELHFEAEGIVNVNCDISNEPYNQAINDQLNLVVKFGEAYNDENIDILILPHGAYEINIAQYIYELIVLAVPTKRTHPGIADGTLNSDILQKLEELNPNQDNTTTTEATDPRWDGLKKLLTDK